MTQRKRFCDNTNRVHNSFCFSDIQDSDEQRERVPWLAMVSFGLLWPKEEELELATSTEFGQPDINHLKRFASLYSTSEKTFRKNGE